MKLNRIFILSLLLCFVSPVLSNADQLEDAKAAIENKDFKKAYKLLYPLAEDSNAAAQTLLGILYVNGQGVEKDATKGLSLIMKAADQGFEPARAHALKLCLRIAKQGATAMYNVGYMCLKGWGGKQDTNDCIEWLEAAAKLGHIRSSKMLSQIYTKGMFDITPDKEKASYWSNIAIGFEEGKAEDKKPTKTHIPFSKKKEEAPSISAVAGASFTIEGFEFRIVKVAFSETASGFVPKDMALGDHVVWVEFELLSGDQEAFEGQKINLTDGSGETRNAFILVSRGYQHMLKTVTMRSASQRYQPGKDCIVWAYAFPKSSDSLFLSFPTGEVVVLSPYMP